MEWFRKRSETSDLEARLRSERPQPRPELLKAVADRVQARTPHRGFRLRVALAAIFTLVMLLAVASVGGVGYAAAAAKQAAESVGKVASSTMSGGYHHGGGDDDEWDDDEWDHHDPDEDQYVKACRDAVKQKMKAEKELHKANMRAADTWAERKAEEARHKAAMRALEQEKKDCKRKREDD